MENINFIPANELPATEAEEVEVLCLENGELKRKPAANLGGGGGGYILKLTAETAVVNDGGITVTSDCADMVRAIDSGAFVSVLVPAGFISEGQFRILCSVSIWTLLEGVLAGIAVTEGMAILLTFPNATIPEVLQG